MDPNFEVCGPKIKEGINVSELITRGFQEFTLDEEDQRLWDSEDVDRMTLEDLYEFEDVQKQVDLDCIKCEPGDVDSTGMPFDALRKNMTNVTEDGKVMKRVLRSGTTAIPEKAFVHLHYNAYVEMNEIPFDSTYLRSTNPVRLQVGLGEQLPGFEIAVLSMTLGEKAQFLVHPDLAFGKMGVGSRIPQNAVIMYVIEVFKVTDCGRAMEEETLDIASRKNFPEVYKRAKAFHELAGEYFREKNFIGAVDNYYKVEKLMVTCSMNNEEEEDKWRHLLFKTYRNIAVCFNTTKLNKPEKVCIAVRKAFEIDAKAASACPKLHYQRGVAREALGDYKEAMKDLKKAQRLAPNDNVINNQLIKLNEKMIHNEKMEKAFCAKAMGFKKPQVEEEDVPEEIDEDCRIAVTEVLKDFAEGSSFNLNLSSGYTTCERAWLKRECERLGLKYEEQDSEGKRDVIISKR